MNSSKSSRLVQSAVTLGVWWALFIDVMGNYAGQGTPSWLPIICGCYVSLIVVHAVVIWRFNRT